MILRKRLFIVDVERGNDLASLDRRNERGFVDERAPRGVNQNGALLHARNVFGADDATAARRQDHMHRDDVGRCP